MTKTLTTHQLEVKAYEFVKVSPFISILVLANITRPSLELCNNVKKNKKLVMKYCLIEFI